MFVYLSMKKDALQDYSKNIDIYKSLAQKVKDIIQENLEDESINYSIIEYRAKTVGSLKKKLDKKVEVDSSYTIENVHDLAGIRIIAYVHSDLELIGPIIRNNFKIIEFKNKIDDLGIEKVGYRSEHFIATLPENRLSLPEYKKFNGLIFEIQLRTILEHTWAEIEHDRRYKYSGVLPENLSRRFSLLSAVLELADNEFDNISQSLEVYASEVSKKAKSGNLDISIDSTSLIQYLNEKFKDLPFSLTEIRLNDSSKILIQELNDMDIDTLKKLDQIIPDDYIQKLQNIKEVTTYSGIVRDILIIKFKELYFKKAWKEHWNGIGLEAISLYKEYQIDIESIMNYYNLTAIEDYWYVSEP